jgi:hypothetical protein
MAGRHSDPHAVSTVVTAVGVKGGVIRRRESFVVCAFRRVDESRRTWRGFGGLVLPVVVGVGRLLSGERVERRWDRRAVMAVSLAWRGCRLIGEDIRER